jgi:hypothetical protein
MTAGQKAAATRRARLRAEDVRGQHIAAAIRIVRRGDCPQCGARLRRNNALAGWWQCEQYGAEGFRKDSSKPDCSFQIFTE